MSAALTFRIDDLTGDPTRALVARHLRGMHANSPACHVHALDIDRLRHPDVTLYSAWLDDTIVGMGALKRIATDRGELKSMRVADEFLGRGFGRAILEYLIGEARARGMRTLWLETGTAPAFIPAIRMYEQAGFRACEAFEGYTQNEFSHFMMREI